MIYKKVKLIQTTIMGYHISVRLADTIYIYSNE